MNKAEQLIACLEGEIAKRDARIAELAGESDRKDDADFNLRGLMRRSAFALSLAPENTSWFEVVGELEKTCAELAAIKAQEPVIDADDLAQFIREIDGNHAMGAGVLAENIAARLNAAPAPVCKTCADSGCDPAFKALVPCSGCAAAPVQQVSVPGAQAFKDELLKATKWFMHPHIEGVFAVFMQQQADAPAAPAADACDALEQAMYTLISIGYHENSGLVHELRQALAAHRAAPAPGGE